MDLDREAAQSCEIGGLKAVEAISQDQAVAIAKGHEWSQVQALSVERGILCDFLQIERDPLLHALISLHRSDGHVYDGRMFRKRVPHGHLSRGWFLRKYWIYYNLIK